MNVRLPDGTVVKNVPEGTSRMELLTRLKRGGYDVQPLLAGEAAPVNPTEGMSGTEKFLAGAGKAFVDVGRGAKQLLDVPAQYLENTFGTLGTGAGFPTAKESAQQTQQAVNEAHQLDQPLMHTGAGLAGNLTGNLALVAPTAAIPGAATIPGGAAIGALMGLLAPTTEGESKLTNAATGAAFGGAGAGAGKLLGRLLRPIISRLTPQQTSLVNEARAAGIPLRTSQVTGSKPLALTESVMENLPFTSETAIAQKAAQQAAFSKAALAKAGVSADAATPEVLLKQKKALGTVFEDISGRNTLDFNAPLSGGKNLASRLKDIEKAAADELTPGDAERVSATIKKILSGQAPATEATQAPSALLTERGVPFMTTVPGKPGKPMLGSIYQAWRTPLSDMARAGTEPGRFFGKIKRALDTAFSEQVGPNDAHAWHLASQQYANLKTIMDAMGGAGALPAESSIAPAQLSAALRRAIGREGVALGRGDLNNLTRVGTEFVSNRLPDSGTAQRAFIQNLLTGTLPGIGVGAAAGAGIAGMTGNSYTHGAAEGALLGGAAGATLPRAVQILINSPAGRKYLEQGLVPLSEEGRNFITNLLRTGGTATQMSTHQRQ